MEPLRRLIPRPARSLLSSAASTDSTAALRDIRLPAPWQVEPNVCSMLPFLPARTYVPVAMSPGMRTGCPWSRYLMVTSLRPGAKARVAPFLCTRTSRPWPSTSCLSIFAMLCATS